MVIKGLQDFLNLQRSIKKLSVDEYCAAIGLKKSTYHSILKFEKIGSATIYVLFYEYFGKPFLDLTTKRSSLVDESGLKYSKDETVRFLREKVELLERLIKSKNELIEQLQRDLKEHGGGDVPVMAEYERYSDLE